MQFTTTIIALLSAASLTVAAPAPQIEACGSAVVSTPEVSTGNTGAANASPTIQARIQFELERQTTFIQRQIPVEAGLVPLNLQTVFSAFIVSVEDIATGEDVDVSVVCQGFDAQGRAVGAQIGEDADNADLNGGQAVAIAAIECVQA
ncbi:hypothetical protein V8F20_001345 [Naviculisporaceae sp. PSN 640]